MWLNTAWCGLELLEEFTTALSLTALHTTFEANMDIMTRQGKYGLPRRSKDRLWTGRLDIKGSCSQVPLYQAESQQVVIAPSLPEHDWINNEQ